MKSVYVEVAVFILMAGLLSACGSQTSDTAASPPTKAAASVNGAPLNSQHPTNTAAPATADPATQSAGQSSQGATVSFANDVLPILQSRCTNCHGGDRTEKGLNLKTYHDLMTGSENGPVIVPGNAADSQFVQMIVNQKMPKRGPKLTPPQVQLITDWVNQGALNN